MPRVFATILSIFLFLVPAFAQTPTTRRLGDLLTEGFQIKTSIGMKLLIVQKEKLAFLCEIPTLASEREYYGMVLATAACFQIKAN